MNFPFCMNASSNNMSRVVLGWAFFIVGLFVGLGFFKYPFVMKF